MNVEQVDIKKIKHLENYRAEYKEHEMVELMSSMKQIGLLQPIGINPQDDGTFVVVFGNRRFKAAVKLGWTSVPAVIPPRKLNRVDFLTWHARENLDRVDPSFTEIGLLLQSYEQLNLTRSEIAVRLSRSVNWVNCVLASFERIPPHLREYVTAISKPGRRKEGHISISQAEQITVLARNHSINPEGVDKLFHFARKNGVENTDVSKVAKLMGGNVSFEDACLMVGKYTRVSVSVSVKNVTIKRLEKSYEKSIHAILREHLAENFGN